MEDYIEGLEKAIEIVETEWELSKLEIDNESSLKYIKMAFCRVVSLIEDEMIQCGKVFPRNYYIDKIHNS
jgi:hypothetical protein